MEVPASGIVLSPEAESSFAALEARAARGDREARSIVKRIGALRGVLLRDALHGEVVKRGFIPAALRRRHGLENLYVEDLPSFWRLLYTVASQDHLKYVVIVEVVDHSAYDKWFPGRGKH